jgi:hypothetical protein
MGPTAPSRTKKPGLRGGCRDFTSTWHGPVLSESEGREHKAHRHSASQRKRIFCVLAHTSLQESFFFIVLSVVSPLSNDLGFPVGGSGNIAEGVVYGPWGPAQSTQKAISPLEQVYLAIA